MSDLYDQIVNNRGGFERLVARIPGFKGYQDKQARRKADTLFRDYLTQQIAERQRRYIRIEKLILDNLGMEFMPRTRDAKAKFQLYHDKVASAEPGYSGMWAQMKIGAEELEKIYSFDEAQVIYLDRLDAVLDGLEQATLNKEGVEQALYGFDGVVTEALDAYALRENVLLSLGNQL